MKTKTTWKMGAYGALIAALFCCQPQIAQAQNFTFNNAGNSSVVTFDQNTGGQFGVYAGEYNATLNGSKANIFCTDFTHEIWNGNQYAANQDYALTYAAASGDALSGSYYQGGLASALNSHDYKPRHVGTLTANQSASEVAWLADQYLNAGSFTSGAGTTALNDNFAGISLAIWDIVQNGGGSTFTFVDGTNTLTLDHSSSAYGGYAKYYEGLADKHNSYTSQTADWIQAPRTMLQNGNYAHLQDYVTELPSNQIPHQSSVPVPEPKFPMLLLSFGVIGSACWLRRRARAQ